jgi:SAM-dependent methyltransferase
MPKRRNAFRSVRDVGLFLAGARADARLKTLRRDTPTPTAAFDRLYADAPRNDPWVSTLAKYQYQRRKYDALVDLLPGRSYRRAIDLGCGLGLLTERLAPRVDEMVGIDISATAVRHAADRTRPLKNIQFRQGDIMALDAELEGRFDLVVVVDAINYAVHHMPRPVQADSLKRIVARISSLLSPEGTLLVANHYPPIPNSAAFLTRRIHSAVEWSPTLTLAAEHCRAFFLASLLHRSAAPDRPR